jgi:CBS domain-containing protein
MYEFLAYRVRDVMTSHRLVVGPNTPLFEVEDIFTTHGFNGLPVVGGDGRLLGLLTKLDVLKAFAFTPRAIVPPYEEIVAQPVDAFYTRDPHTVSPDTPLTRVLEDLVRTRYKSCPVVEKGRLVGMVAREDLLRALRAVAGGRSTAGS